jgi:hypothetical protein
VLGDEVWVKIAVTRTEVELNCGFGVVFQTSDWSERLIMSMVYLRMVWK